MVTKKSRQRLWVLVTLFFVFYGVLVTIDFLGILKHKKLNNFG